MRLDATNLGEIAGIVSGVVVGTRFIETGGRRLLDAGILGRALFGGRGRPSYTDWQASVNDTLGELLKRTEPNGLDTNSIGDMARRTELAVQELGNTVGTLKANVDRLSEDVENVRASVDRRKNSLRRFR